MSLVVVLGCSAAFAGNSRNLQRLNASIEAQLKARAGQVNSDPQLVKQHLIALVSAMPALVPGDQNYADRMMRLRTRIENFTPEETAQLARVDDAALAPAVETIVRSANARRQLRASATALTPHSNIVGPASHPLPDQSSIYDTLCGSTPNDANTEHGEVIGINVANIAAIVGDVACNSIVVVLGEGTNLPACIIAGALHEVAEGLQFALDLQTFCDGDITGTEDHTTFENLYHLHNDLINSVANDDGNKAAVITDIDSKSAALINQLNANTTAILNDVDARASALSTQLTNATTTIVNNSNANRDAMIAELRVVGCELDRLMNTPEGQRSSSIVSCSAQPGFPYKFSGSGAKSIGSAPAVSAVASPSADAAANRGQDGVPILPMMGTVTMETNLLEGRMIPSYYLPASRGGMLEQVQSLVWNTINAQLELTIAIEQTEQSRIIAREADQLFVQQKFVDAYRRYSAAYQALLPPSQAIESARTAH